MIQLYNGDCLEIMRNIPDGSVDMILCDPPYNIGKSKWDYIDNYVEWWTKCVTEMGRCLKKNGVMYFWHNKPSVFCKLICNIENSTDFRFKSLLVWDKPNILSRGLAYIPENNGLRSWFDKCEYLLYFERPNLFAEVLEREIKRLGIKQVDIAKLRLSNSGGCTGWISNILNGSTPKREDWDLICSVIGHYDYDSLAITHNTDANHCNVITTPNAKRPKHHICEKPIDVVERIIKVSSNPGEVVLDCCMGSGTTGVACVNTGRRFIGIELDAGYFEIAQKRIEEANSQIKMEVSICD